MQLCIMAYYTTDLRAGTDLISNRPYNVAIHTKPFPITKLSTVKVALLTAVEAYIY